MKEFKRKQASWIIFMGSVRVLVYLMHLLDKIILHKNLVYGPVFSG
jgi:hypothetical protein